VTGVFWRRSTEDAATTSDSGVTTTESPQSAGKGRPTPTRREAEASRKKQMRPPRDRREAARIQRDKLKQERSSARQALVTGDERYLPARDRGPVRKYTRDLVDSRRTIGEYFLFVGFAIVALSFTGSGVLLTYASALWLALLVFLAGEAVMVGRRVGRALDARFPPAKGPYDGRKGAVTYAIMRNFQLRRMRLPKPAVKPGDKV
jgi:hypothetical protein